MPVATAGISAGGRPTPAAILPARRAARVSRSLRRSCGASRSASTPRSTPSIDACADPAAARTAGSTPRFVDAYVRLHELGWAHWSRRGRATGELVGGLYGVAIGGLFAGESMFHRAHRRVEGRAGARWSSGCAAVTGALLDVQWSTPHLPSLGVVDVPRPEYLAGRRAALGRRRSVGRRAGGRLSADRANRPRSGCGSARGGSAIRR